MDRSPENKVLLPVCYRARTHPRERHPGSRRPAGWTLHAPGIRLGAQGPGVRAERRGVEGPAPPLRDRRRETLGETGRGYGSFCGATV